MHGQAAAGEGEDEAGAAEEGWAAAPRRPVPTVNASARVVVTRNRTWWGSPATRDVARNAMRS